MEKVEAKQLHKAVFFKKVTLATLTTVSHSRHFLVKERKRWNFPIPGAAQGFIPVFTETSRAGRSPISQAQGENEAQQVSVKFRKCLVPHFPGVSVHLCKNRPVVLRDHTVTNHSYMGKHQKTAAQVLQSEELISRFHTVSFAGKVFLKVTLLAQL